MTVSTSRTDAADCAASPWTACCPDRNQPLPATDGQWYCNSTATAISDFTDFVATPVTNGSVDELRCELYFDYVWDDPPASPNCGDERELRVCAFACAGNDGSCGASCLTYCAELGAVGEGAQYFDHAFANPGSGFDTCYYCWAVILDVTGNTSCNPPSSSPCNLGPLGTCSANCGQPIVEAKSYCANLNP